MIKSTCKQCGLAVTRRGTRRGIFCSLRCKGDWQRAQKPLSRERLFQLYVQNGLGTYQIAQLVGRDPKRVYEWLRDYGIPIRIRNWEVNSGSQPYHERTWLHHHYVELGRSASEIAAECGVTENNILFFLQKLSIPRRRMGEIRACKYWGALGPANPMYGVTGAENPNWRGGITPERQAFYLSEEWRRASRQVWHRDKASCQRCGLVIGPGIELHIHHKVSFGVTSLRSALSNLVLLCRACHAFVHSRRNTGHEFLAGKRAGPVSGRFVSPCSRNEK